MARFRGTLWGQGGQVSGLGSARSGLTVTANGWDFGAEVILTIDADGNDSIEITLTGGSNGALASGYDYRLWRGTREMFETMVFSKYPKATDR